MDFRPLDDSLEATDLASLIKCPSITLPLRALLIVLAHGDHDGKNKEIKHMQNKHPASDRRKLSPHKIASYAGFATGAILLICVLVLLFFPNPFLNKIIKPRITGALAKAYPAYSLSLGDIKYNVFKNLLEIDSVAMIKADGSQLSNMGLFSVSGIGWMHLLWRGKPAANDFANAVVDAQNVVLNFPQSQYIFQCERLHASVPDSEIVARFVKFQPSGDDEQLFAGSKFRRTRYRLNISDARVIGVECLDMIKGKSYSARSAQIQDAFLDILVNKDKPFDYTNTISAMPHRILASMKEILRVDSLSVMNGQLKYGERYAVGAEPALITIDSIQVQAKGIANHGNPGAAIVIRARGNFAKAGTMNVLMTIPVESREYSFKYSGSLSGMDLRAFNSFLEISEQIRIKAGALQSASFEINVDSGCASGNLRAIYSDLAVAAINKETGSKKGISDRTATIIAKILKIRGTNVPDKSGLMKIGKVNFTLKPDEAFFEYAWFALRSGIQDIVGF